MTAHSLLQIGDLEQELVWSLLAKPPAPPPEARSNQAPDSGLFESGGSRGYTAGGPLSEKWSEIFPQEQSRRGQLDDKSWTSYLRSPHCPYLFDSSSIIRACMLGCFSAQSCSDMMTLGFMKGGHILALRCPFSVWNHAACCLLLGVNLQAALQAGGVGAVAWA